MQGDYEDSDLCLRLAAGRGNWYMPEVELYHLEGQSCPGPCAPANRYNMWLHTHLWGEQIAGLIERDFSRLATRPSGPPEPAAAAFLGRMPRIDW